VVWSGNGSLQFGSSNNNKTIMADAAAAAAAASSSSPSLDFLSVLFHTHFLVSQTWHWVSFCFSFFVSVRMCSCVCVCVFSWVQEKVVPAFVVEKW
jgi:hypothetical protein